MSTQELVARCIAQAYDHLKAANDAEQAGPVHPGNEAIEELNEALTLLCRAVAELNKERVEAKP